MQLKNRNISRAAAEDARLLSLKIWLRKNYRYNFLGSILSTTICTYVPIQRCHVFVAGYVLPSFSYTVSKYQLRRAARAVFAEVPYPCCRISRSTEQLMKLKLLLPINSIFKSIPFQGANVAFDVEGTGAGITYRSAPMSTNTTYTGG